MAPFNYITFWLTHFKLLLYYIVLFRIDILPGFSVIVDLNAQLQSFEDHDKAFVLIPSLFSAKPLLWHQPIDAMYIHIEKSMRIQNIDSYFFLFLNIT